MKYKTIEIDGKKVTVDENGKPCKACNTLLAFQGITNLAPTTREEPPDSAQLGRHTWTFLHSMAAYYPKTPSDKQKNEMATFISTFGSFYPCAPCAEDFRQYVDQHPPDVTGRDQLSRWFCDAHNAVNVKLGKSVFDCNTWKKRWLDGWT